MSTVLVVNPRSGAGRTAAALPAIERAAREQFGDVRVLYTERPQHAGELAAHAVQHGARLVIAVGGDGTAHEVVDGLVRRTPPGARPTFAVLPAGTGSDLARTLGIGRDPIAALAAIAASQPRPIDVLRCAFDGPDGPTDETAVNIAGFGINGEVVRRANQGSKRLGGRLTFLIATLGALVHWRGRQVALSWTGPDGDGGWCGLLSAGFVCNAQFCGGGILAAPGASMDDGVADLVVVPQQPVWRSVRSLPSLYDGTLGTVPGVVTARVTTIEVQAVGHDGPLLVDLDGEQPGRAPLRIGVVPGRLFVQAPRVGPG